MDFVKTGDIVTHYRLDGDADKPLMVFANSLGTDFRTWDGVVERLASRFRCLRYDKRGHGLTTLTPGPYSIDQLVGDLFHLLEVLELSPRILCGLSVGGMIGQRFGSVHGDRLKGLVLCDTAMVIGTPEIWQQRIDAITEGGMEAVADPTMERWFSTQFLARRDVELSAMRTMLTRMPVDGYIGVSHAISGTDLTDDAGSISVPTLCVGGDEDGATTPEMMAELAGTVPRARHEVIASCGHLPCVEHPQVLAELLLDFADRHELG